MKFHPAIAALILAACSREAVEFEMSGQAAGGQMSYVGPVLEQARRDFFGPGGTGGTGGTAGGSGNFGLDETVRVRGAPPAVLALGVTRRDDLGPGWALRSGLSVAVQGVQVHLPDGLGVLTDPMQVTIAAQSVQAQVTLGRTLPLPWGWRAEVEAGVGLQSVAAQAHLSSALIDLVSDTTVTQPYGVLAGRALSGRGLGLTGNILLFQAGQAEYRLGVIQTF